jgi:hypothetical protein
MAMGMNDSNRSESNPEPGPQADDEPRPDLKPEADFSSDTAADTAGIPAFVRAPDDTDDIEAETSESEPSTLPTPAETLGTNVAANSETDRREVKSNASPASADDPPSEEVIEDLNDFESTLLACGS